MSIATIFNAQTLVNAKNNLKKFENDLVEHLKTDWAGVKADIEECIAHWKTEMARVEALVPPAVVAHLAEGASVQYAVEAAAQGIEPHSVQVAAAVAKAKLLEDQKPAA